MSEAQDIAEAAACHLLELPAELRNRIYRLVLHRNKHIQVATTGYEREDMLSTCRQIRQEAIKIYYYENTFRVTMPDWNTMDTFKRFYDQTRRLGLESVKSLTTPKES